MFVENAAVVDEYAYDEYVVVLASDEDAGVGVQLGEFAVLPLGELSSTERVQWKLRDGNGITSQPEFFRCREWLVAWLAVERLGH